MLPPARRYLALVLAALLAVPLLATGFGPREQAERSHEEDRILAPWPPWPRTLRDWRALPRTVDAYLADHFGLRRALIHAEAVLAHRWLHDGNQAVLVGSNGRLFYLGDAAVAQSAGLVMRSDRIDETVATISRMARLLAQRGIAFVVAPPPNAATVYDDDLPDWARNHGRPTEPERVLAALRARGLTTVDLASILRAARSDGNLYYRDDTHWNFLGALLAFNAVAAAAGHPDWALRPAEALSPPGMSEQGDLGRMLGLDDLAEPNLGLPLTAHTERIGPEEERFDLSTGPRSGPAVLVIGDSFTEDIFAAFALVRTGRVGWLHHRGCGFDWSWIDRFHPDEVWWMPTERYILCDPGITPNGMPEEPQARADARTLSP